MNHWNRHSVNKSCQQRTARTISRLGFLFPAYHIRYSPIAICLLFICIHFFVGSFCTVGSNFFGNRFHFGCVCSPYLRHHSIDSDRTSLDFVEKIVLLFRNLLFKSDENINANSVWPIELVACVYETDGGVCLVVVLVVVMVVLCGYVEKWRTSSTMCPYRKLCGH